MATKKIFTKKKIIKREGFPLMDMLLFFCERFYIAHNSDFIYAASDTEYYGRDLNYFGNDLSRERTKGDIRFQIPALEEISRLRWKELWMSMPYQPMDVYFDELDEAHKQQNEERDRLKNSNS